MLEVFGFDCFCGDNRMRTYLYRRSQFALLWCKGSGVNDFLIPPNVELARLCEKFAQKGLVAAETTSNT
jgi:hypothetical protein